MKKKLFLIILVLAASLGVVGQRDPNTREAKPGEVPFVYNANDYGKVEIEQVAKSVAEPNNIPTEAPAHSCYHLEDKRALPALDQGPRYFYPAQSIICIIPLTDASVTNFAKSYPSVHEAAAKLRKLLTKRPSKFKFHDDLNDLPYNNATGVIQSKLEYLTFKTGTGLLFLTQYSQEMLPNPINNEELTCNFQGLSNDGKYYVAARLTITHPSLPKGIDFTTRPPDADKTKNYLRKDERLLNSLTDESFIPSLKSLKSLITSITTD